MSLGLVLLIGGCASSPSLAPLPGLAAKQTAAGLIPRDYFSDEGRDQEAPEPQMVSAVQAFLKENDMFLDQEQSPAVLNRQVRLFVRHFSEVNRDNFARCLSRSGRYLPMMRRIFREHGLPPDLVYLALVESGFDPWARSPAEAVGPWQFIEATARRYGLTVNDWLDERRDPEKATHAAARYLKDLYRQFGSWYLAAAGYNAGENLVEGVIRRHDTRDFWTMADRRLLPRETCNYVPQLIAAALIAKHPEHYGFGEVEYQRPWAADRVRVSGGIDLHKFAGGLGLPVQLLKELNPELKLAYIPVRREGYYLRVPRGKAREARLLALAAGEPVN
ncbi:MAG: transglycosylase SLT domain-containing protein [Deltaproteobacteria bacterium]|nr:transglycosylase SLT domain-containing protein [Deltaproteobacteria bacterium]